MLDYGIFRKIITIIIIFLFAKRDIHTIVIQHIANINVCIKDGKKIVESFNLSLRFLT